MPWTWRTGPSDSSERDHLQAMRGELPKNSLIAADAGFVGYEFWQSILDAGHHFLIRVGGNVKLIRNLGYVREYNHTIYLWPKDAVKKHRKPMVLRLIVLNDGRKPMYLVTNLTKAQLSDSQAAIIYSKRWGIELFFRTFKQTFECHKLQAKAGHNCPIELDWSLLALWCVCLLGRCELAKSGAVDHRLSAAKAIQAFHQCLFEYRIRPESSDQGLMSKLSRALLDDYHRTSSKASRDYPRQKKRVRVGRPKIKRADKEQILAAKQLKQQAI